MSKYLDICMCILKICRYFGIYETFKGTEIHRTHAMAKDKEYQNYLNIFSNNKETTNG